MPTKTLREPVRTKVQSAIVVSDKSELLHNEIPLELLNLPANSIENKVKERVLSRTQSDFIVKLQYASSFYWSGAGQAGRAVTIQVAVKKIGTIYDMQLHYKNYDGQWLDRPIPQLSDCGNYIVFSISENQFSVNSDLVFCLRCTIDGIDHWDNNNWNDYSLPSNDCRIIPGNIKFDQADIVTYECPNWMNAYHSNLNGKLLIRDLDWVKHVGIRYTWDGWRSWSDVTAYWVQNFSFGKIQLWQFRAERYTAFNLGIPTFEFAAFYMDGRTGIWYWDNNFNQNFRIKYPESSHLD